MSVCKAKDCPAAPLPGRDVCPIHAKAQRAEYSAQCAACKRVVEAGEWVKAVTGEFGGCSWAHVVCPAKAATKRKPAPRPALLAAIEGAQ
jgi:hypothetical protein